jgi:hypothetical protein
MLFRIKYLCSLVLVISLVWVSADCPDWATSLSEEVTHHVGLVVLGFTIQMYPRTFDWTCLKYYITLLHPRPFALFTSTRSFIYLPDHARPKQTQCMLFMHCEFLNRLMALASQQSTDQAWRDYHQLGLAHEDAICQQEKEFGVSVVTVKYPTTQCSWSS